MDSEKNRKTIEETGERNEESGKKSTETGTKIEETGTKNENAHVYDLGWKPKKVNLKADYALYRRGAWYGFWNKIACFCSTVIALFPKFFIWGTRVTGRENKKYMHSCVLVSNHVYPVDFWMILSELFPRSFYVTVLQSNLGLGILSWYLRLCGAVPIPQDMYLFQRFKKETPEIIKKGHCVLFYSEASLIPYCDHIRHLLPGAFRFALESTGVIIPTVITFHKPKGFYKLVRGKKPCIHYNILKPYYMQDLGDEKQSAEKGRRDVEQLMSDFFVKNSDYYYDENGKRNSTPMPDNRFIKDEGMV